MGARVLIVEDEEEVREAFAEYLRGLGLQVTECSTAAEARRALRDQRFDVMVTDLKLPDAEGLDLVHEARAGVVPPLCIGMSGYATIEDAVDLLTGGGAWLLLKPFKLRDAYAIVVKVMEREAARRDLGLRAMAGTWLEAVALAGTREELAGLVPGLAAVVQSVEPDGTAALAMDGTLVVKPAAARFLPWTAAFAQAWARLG